MAKGVKQDLQGIQRYKTAAGIERYRVRLRASGQRLSQSFLTLDEAIRWRNAKLDERRNGHQVSKPKPRRKGRNLVNFVRDEYWPAHVQKELTKKTRNNYGHHFRRWVAKSPIAGKAPELIDAEDISEWQQWCRDKGATEHQIRQALKVISGAYSWAAQYPRKTGIHGNPVSGAKWPKERRSVTPYIAEPLVVEKVRLAILNGNGRELTRCRGALLFSLMAQTGMRPGEARLLQLHDVGDEVIELPAEKTKMKSEGRAIPLPAPLAEDIAEFVEIGRLGKSSYLIGQRDPSQPMSFTGWERFRNDLFAPARDSVAAELGDQRLAQARAYDLCRHSFAALQIAALMPLNELAQIMGHSVDVLSKVYAAPLVSVSKKRKRGNYEPIDPEAEVLAARRALSNGEVSSRS